MKSLVLLLLVVPLYLSAQITPTNILFQGTGKSNDYALSDINKDGTLDILVASTSGLAWYPNTNSTQTSYRRQHLIDATKAYYSVVVLDLNKDRWPDIVATTEAAGDNMQLVWYKNNGNGNFELQTSIDNHRFSQSQLFLKDLNRDAWADIVLSTSEGSVIYLNDAAGNFLRKNTLSETFQISQVADIDGDTYPDLVEIKEHHLRVRYNNSYAKFGEAEAIINASNISRFDIMDINDNGLLDIAQLLVNNTETELLLHSNEGAGTFSTRSIPISNIPYEAEKEIQIYLRYMNADDLRDLVIIVDNDAIYWFKNLGDYTFEATPTLAKSVLGVAIQPEDTNQDGITDFIEIEGALRYLLLHENDGNGNLIHTDVAENGRIMQTIITDLNNDNYEDVLAFFAYDNEARAYLNDQAGGFEEQLYISDTPIEQLIDMDNDGDLDALTYSYNRALWSENDGANNFRNRYLIAVDDAFRDAAFYCCSPTSPLVGDFNDDGIPDILVYRRAERTLSWYDGQSLEETIIRTDFSIIKMQLGDMDNDGDTDLLCNAPEQPTSIHLLQNDGTGSFEDSTIGLPIQNAASSLKLIDVNGDAYLDILEYCTTTACNNAMYYYENNAGNSFSLVRTIENYTSELPPIVIDIDLDGDQDIIQSNFDTEQVAKPLSVMLNDGNQQFQLSTIEGLNSIRGIQRHDFDQDGQMELLITSLPTANEPEALFLANYPTLFTPAPNSMHLAVPNQSLAYPNPFQQAIRIPFDVFGKEYQACEIRIFNQVGQRVFPNISYQNSYAIISGIGLEAGLYFYQILWQHQVLQSGNMVKQH